MRLRAPATAILSFVACICATADDTNYPWREAGFIPVAVSTADETTLMYQVLLPDPAVWGSGPYSTVIDYSGYEPATTIFDGLDDRFLAAGYAVAGINMRGTGGSGDNFDYFEPRQGRDGADAIEWMARRPWSNGRFGMVGKSWPGISQMYVAAEQPPHLKAIVPGNIFADLYRDVAFPGGVMNVTFDSYWSLARLYESYITGPIYYSEYGDQQVLINQLGHLPNVLTNPLVHVLTNLYDSDFYHERSASYFADRVNVPVFLFQSWQDEQVGSRAVHVLERLRPGLSWRFCASNGDHGDYYGSHVFPHILRFLSYHLKQEVPAGERRTVTAPLILPNGKPHPTKTITRPETFAEALARYQAEDRVIVNWENGAGGDRTPAWTQTYDTWPPSRQTVWRLNLRADGTLTESAYPNPPLGGLLSTLTPRDLGAVDYLYSPLVGTQARGGYNIEAPLIDVEAVPPGRWSDRPPQGTFAEFTSPVLTGDKVLMGSASVDLTVSSTAVDTDFEVTLSEIRPDGQETFVQQGWLRASHRLEDSSLSTPLRPHHTHVLTDASFLLAGQPTKVRIEVFPFGHVFRAGSRIRLAVTAPHVHPDLWGFAGLPIPALNTIYTSKNYPSSVALPLLAGDAAQTGYPPVNTLRNQPSRPVVNTPPMSITTLPPAEPSQAFVDSWLNAVLNLFPAGESIQLPDAFNIASVPYTELGTWMQDWLGQYGLETPPPPTGPAVVPPMAHSDWQAYAAATAFDLSQPDSYFVQMFDNWYDNWLATR